MTNLWLGAEYNQNHNHVVSTDLLMRQFLKFGKIDKNTRFFVRLEVQVGCFGNPNDFYYDDVSCVKATGNLTEKNQYYQNVLESVDHHVSLFNKLNPRIILIGGSEAFDAWRRLILPRLEYDYLTVVKIRNPSPNAHRKRTGESGEWNDKYRKYKADLSRYKSRLNLLHLYCADLKSDFKLIELPN